MPLALYVDVSEDGVHLTLLQVLDGVRRRRHLMQHQILSFSQLRCLSAVFPLHSSFGHDVVPVLPSVQLQISNSSFVPTTFPPVPGYHRVVAPMHH